MSNRIFKNYQINLGMPFQVKVPFNIFEAFDAPGDAADAFIYRGACDGCMSDEEAVTAENVFAAGALGLVDAVDAIAAADKAVEGAASAVEEAYDAAAIAAQARQDALAKLREAQVEAERIIAETEDRCQAMEAEASKRAAAAADDAGRAIAARMAKAEEECAALRQKAEEQGRREGYADGQARGHAEYDALIAGAEATLEEARQKYRELLEGAEGDALELVLKIARKAVGEEMAANKQNMLHLVRDAFSHCSNKEMAVLKVAPDDYDYVRANKDVLLSMVEGVGKLEIKRDLSLSSGACLVETSLGAIDASVETRLSKIEDAFRRVLAKPA